jgi:hypothetical protein
VARGSVATTIAVRLRDDCAWALLGAPRTGSVSEMIIVFFPSLSVPATHYSSIPRKCSTYLDRRQRFHSRDYPGLGSQRVGVRGRPVSAVWMASMARTPRLRALTREMWARKNRVRVAGVCQ